MIKIERQGIDRVMIVKGSSGRDAVPLGEDLLFMMTISNDDCQRVRNIV